MRKSKIVIALQSICKQRSNVDKSHCLTSTGMTLFHLNKCMRMSSNIFDLQKVATKNILQPTTIIINRHRDTNNEDMEEIPNAKKESLEIDQRNPSFISSRQSITTAAAFDVDIETLKSISPQSFSNDADDSSTKIQTCFTYPRSENGLKIKGDKPTIIHLNESFDLNDGQSGVILYYILKGVLSGNMKTCIICNTQDEALLTKFSLEMNKSEYRDVQYYTPCLELRLPTYEEKELICSNNQTSSSVLVCDYKGFRGCEAENIVAFANQEDEFSNHVLVEILARATIHLTLLVLPCKSKNTSMKHGTLRHIIQLWKEKQAVTVMNVSAEHYAMDKYSVIDYEEFKKHENRPMSEDIRK